MRLVTARPARGARVPAIILDMARSIGLDDGEAHRMELGEIRELVVGSKALGLPTVRLIRLSPEARLHEHSHSLTLVRVMSGTVRSIDYVPHAEYWSRYAGGLYTDVKAQDLSKGAEWLVGPDRSVHQLLALAHPAVVLEAHWPPLVHSVEYSVRGAAAQLLVPKGEWFSAHEKRRRFLEGGD